MSRENGWPSAERDLLRFADGLHRLLPVGFYYKVGSRPRWLWPRLEPLVRSLAGRGTIDLSVAPESREARHLHCELLVIGGGVAGLAAAATGARNGMSVVVCDEGAPAERVPLGQARSRLEALVRDVQSSERIQLLVGAPAIGLYEGPLVVLNGRDHLHIVHPRRIVVATGAVETHDVFQGSDIPGVWLGRGAVRMAAVHEVRPGAKAVIVGAHHEVPEQVEALLAAGLDVLQVGDIRVKRAHGRRVLRRVILEDGRSIKCDVLVLARGFVPRDNLLRQGDGLPVVGAGQVIAPACSIEQAEESGRRAALGEAPRPARASLPEPATTGYVCLCEDVAVEDLELAWAEGFQSTEILKRYTTATMGPCRGALCHGHLRSFVAARLGSDAPVAGPTTARPPASEITVEEAAAGERATVLHRTSLHDHHLALGATMEPAGVWWRPEHYGDVEAEYWAVRRAVSMMDVGTLGKFLVAGPDVVEFLERLYPCKVGDLVTGRIRYALLLGRHGYVIDDGLICALESGRYYLTFTTNAAERTEAHLRDWIDRWRMDVHVVNRTSAVGAINVAGPRARDLLRTLCEEPVDVQSFPYLRHRQLTVAGVPCRVVRLGFVGELSYELHHPSSRSVELWDALTLAGADLGVRPHGLEALRLLRLEKGHVIIGQDTDFDSTPEKLGMSWAVKMEKTSFIGRTALERIGGVPIERRLLAFRFEGGTPCEGTPLWVKGTLVGNLTSSRFSPVLGYGVGLGWCARVDAAFPSSIDANGVRGVAVEGPFYDPTGERVRA